uniref:Uncharacterized protein n=1 Tax=Oryza glaberrima TaxID=4538 RepID=I1QCC8_ORYGL
MEGGREAAAAEELAGGGGGGAVGAARRRGPRAVSHLVVLLHHQRRPRRLLPWPDGDLDEHDDGDGVAVTAVLEHLGGLAQRVADADGLPWPWAAAQTTRRSTIWRAERWPWRVIRRSGRRRRKRRRWRGGRIASC